MSYLEFRETPSPSGATKIIDVIAKQSGIQLGVIKWHAPWRKYCYFPNDATLYDANCMSDIVEKIKLEMKARRDK